MGKMSKQKGAGFERDMSRGLSGWLSNGERGDLFWRSAMSGGRATVAQKNNIVYAAQAGDLSAIHPLGAPLIALFSVECKAYAKLYYDNIVFGADRGVRSMWINHSVDAVRYDKLPMLICKENYKPPTVILDRKGACIIFNHSFKRMDYRLKLHCPELDLYLYKYSDMIAADPANLINKGIEKLKNEGVNVEGINSDLVSDG